MAIHPLSSPQQAPTQDAPTITTSAPSEVTTMATLAVPFGGKPSSRRVAPAVAPTNPRDSLKLREALLRGKEGTRRRQRWENGAAFCIAALLCPSESNIRPLHPQRHVPYEYASLWDSPAFQKRYQHNNQSKQHVTVDKVPKELKARLKRSHAAVDLLQGLEEEVRKFVLGTQKVLDEVQERSENLIHVNIDDTQDDSEEEIVFISKKLRYQMKEEMVSSVFGGGAMQKVLFESFLSDPSASFGRWLVHSIATYYGLKSWSVTTGNPAMRLTYVGFRSDNSPASLSSAVSRSIPKPLYLMV